MSGDRTARARAWSARALLAIAGAALSAPAAAQEFTQEFINPSFGGNPFYSEHLRGIAGLDRPDEPEEEEEVTSPEELLVQQLRSQLTSTVTSNILRAIQTATPGQSGDFIVGDQRITFTRSATETRVTFVNTRTGETSTIVIPVLPGSSNPFGSAGNATTASAEQALIASPSGIPGASLGRAVGGPLSGPVASASPSTAARAAPRLGSSSRESALLAPPPLQ